MNSRKAAVRSGRERVCRAAAVLVAAAILFWMATLWLVRVTYFGKAVSCSVERGYAAVYWGEKEELRNSRILNRFTWPDLPTMGAGTSWTEENWGRWYILGPPSEWSSDALRYPQSSLGLFLPGWGKDDAGVKYVGMPVWCIAVVAAAVACCYWFLPRRRRGDVCARCGYSKRGSIPGAPCPECGSPVPAQ